MSDGSGVRVRRATTDDIPAILDISNDAAARTAANFAIEPEPLDAWRADHERTADTHPWLVATFAGPAVIGFARASPWKGRCAYAFSVEISAYVDPAHHGRGVGRALYGVLVPVLRGQGYRSVLAGITLPNPASVRLHESFGLTRVARFRRIGWKFDRWHDVGYWQGALGEEDAPPPATIRPVGEVMGEERD